MNIVKTNRLNLHTTIHHLDDKDSGLRIVVKRYGITSDVRLISGDAGEGTLETFYQEERLSKRVGSLVAYLVEQADAILFNYRHAMEY